MASNESIIRQLANMGLVRLNLDKLGALMQICLHRLDKIGALRIARDLEK